MKTVAAALLLAIAFTMMAQAQSTNRPLRDVKNVQIEPTIISEADKVKDTDAAGAVEKTLRRAFLVNEFQPADSAPVKAHIVLNEFNGGSFAKRFIVGFGSGSSTIDCDVVLSGEDGKELAKQHVRVRGGWLYGSYQGNSNQTGQAEGKFEKALFDAIEKWR